MIEIRSAAVGLRYELGLVERGIASRALLDELELTVRDGGAILGVEIERDHSTVRVVRGLVVLVECQGIADWKDPTG